LHDNFQLKLVFDKKKQANIDYTVGVWQGDNMAGLLFLFLMQAMDESFKKQCALTKPEFLNPSWLQTLSTTQATCACQDQGSTISLQ
jgi:hypothetical protein